MITVNMNQINTNSKQQMSATSLKIMKFMRTN